MILGIQVLGVLFCLFMLYLTFLHRKRNEFNFKEGIFWLFFWILFLMVTLWPGILDPIVRTLSLSRTMDFFIIIGFMFLIGIMFYIYTITRKNQKKIDKIVRDIALKKEE